MRVFFPALGIMLFWLFRDEPPPRPEPPAFRIVVPLREVAPPDEPIDISGFDRNRLA